GLPFSFIVVKFYFQGNSLYLFMAETKTRDILEQVRDRLEKGDTTLLQLLTRYFEQQKEKSKILFTRTEGDLAKTFIVRGCPLRQSLTFKRPIREEKKTPIEVEILGYEDGERKVYVKFESKESRDHFGKLNDDLSY